MKIRKRTIILLVTLFALAALSQSFSTGNASSNSTPSVYGNITAAYYANISNSANYDIIYNMSFNLADFSSSNSANGYYYTLIVGLTYPDGSTYWYQFNLVSYTQYFKLQVIWINAATQSGWYTAQSYTYPTYKNNNAYYSSYEFDPPSLGVTGASPQG